MKLPSSAANPLPDNKPNSDNPILIIIEGNKYHLSINEALKLSARIITTVEVCIGS